MVDFVVDIYFCSEVLMTQLFVFEFYEKKKQTNKQTKLSITRNQRRGAQNNCACAMPFQQTTIVHKRYTNMYELNISLQDFFHCPSDDGQWQSIDERVTEF